MMYFNMRVFNYILLFIIFFLFALNIDTLWAKERGALGAGVILGDPIGPTLKYWLHPNTAIDVGLGFEKDFTVYADFLWHEWNIFSKNRDEKLSGYLGHGSKTRRSSPLYRHKFLRWSYCPTRMRQRIVHCRLGRPSRRHLPPGRFQLP